MWTQSSYRSEGEAGTLYLVPTPIGNLEDMTFRAVRLLKEADFIAAEDTRNTIKLCRHFSIDTPLVSYHEHNKAESGEKLMEELKSGKTVALVSDAGMPAISDPGVDMVKQCVQNEIFVVALPGANAALTSLVASGMDTGHFFFYGFLPRQANERKRELNKLKEIQATLIFYEAPHRLKATVCEMAEQFGERKVCIARELTKTYEEWIRGDLCDAEEIVESITLKGEFCIVVQGEDPKNQLEEIKWWSELTIEEHVRHYVEIREMPAKEAIKRTAVERGKPKREVYNVYHRTK